VNLRLALGLAVAVLAASPLLAKDEQADPKNETTHVVQPGETLGGIAVRADVPRVLIIEANGLKPPYAVKAGQRLVIPRRRSHTVADGETAFSIALDYGVPWATIATANRLDPAKPVHHGQVLTIPTLAKPVAQPAPKPAPKPVAAAPASPAPAPAPAPAPSATPPAPKAKPLADTAAPAFAWPVKGKLRRTFAAKDAKGGQHDGIDLRADRGTAVTASADGRVIFAGEGPKDYGLTVIIYHAGRWTTTYGFLGKITVKDGDRVKAGERIGLIGQSGIATEPSLHFEVRRNRVALDPKLYLPKAQNTAPIAR